MEAEKYLASLIFDVKGLLSTKESADLRAKTKMAQAGIGSKRERPYPDAPDVDDDSGSLVLSAYPWNQKWPTRPTISLAMMGRSLRIGLTFCDDKCSDQVTTLIWKSLKDEQEVIFKAFSHAAGDTTQLAAALCAVPGMTLYAISRAKAVLHAATLLAVAHPTSTFIAHVAACRASQSDTISTLFDELTRRVNTVVSATQDDKKTQCAVAMYHEFVSSWMSPVYSPSTSDELEELWKRLSQARSSLSSGGGGAGPADRKASRTVIGGDGSGQPTPAGGAASAGGGTTDGQRTGKFTFRQTIPSSIDIVGNTLGVAHSSRCSVCQPAGRFHHPSECPVRWAKAGILLPGFDASGTRDPTAWRRSNEPIKETIRAWIALIKDSSNWTAAVPSKAGIPDAPGLANFEAQLLRAPDKP